MAKEKKDKKQEDKKVKEAAGYDKSEDPSSVRNLAGKEEIAEIDQLKAKAAERDEFYDKYVRTNAEFDNARKRMEKDAASVVSFANERIISELFPILDSFDSAIENLNSLKTDSKIMEGLTLLQKKFHKVLEDNGLTLMECKGQKFDPIKHEAVMKVPSEDVQDGFIAEELRKGYMLYNRVLRPAMVKVAENNKDNKK